MYYPSVVFQPFLYKPGPNCPYEKLDAIREKQEELMRLHFEQDRKIQLFINAGSGHGRRPVRS